MNIHFGVISSLSLPLFTAQTPRGPRLGQDNQDSEPIVKPGPSGKSLKPVDLTQSSNLHMLLDRDRVNPHS